MSAMAETAGTYSRTIRLAENCKKANIDVAVCSAHDINYKPIKGIKNYFLTVPMPLGLPKMIAANMFPIAQKLGITRIKTVKSFEDVLHLTGNIDYKYLKKSISDIQHAIHDFKPDVIYSEFSISAIIAGKIEHKKMFITASFPTQYEYSCTPKYAYGLNKILKEYKLPPVISCLQLFSWADKKFIPSCYELEPFQDDVTFCGAFKEINPMFSSKRNNILVYMGNGTISQKKMLKEIISAFKDCKYSVYIAGKGLKAQALDNIKIAPYFDFQALLPDSLLFINHGGQNSMVDGLIFGVPQLICAGKVFERNYNAKSILKIGAGLEISYKDFVANNIKILSERIISNPIYQKNALKMGDILLSLGGTQKIIESLKS